MGSAITDYYLTGKAAKLRVFSPMFEEDEIPVPTLFRSYDNMQEIERKALNLARGKTLDVGAGSGCHSIFLQQQGVDVTAIDISALSVDVMKKRGIRKVFEQDFFMLKGRYDTILMLMNGIGIVETLQRMPEFFKVLDHILAPGGQLLCDSTDIRYVFEDENGDFDFPDTSKYYGELSYRMQYKNTISEPFNWLYIDIDTLKRLANQNGYSVEVLVEGEQFNYLAQIIKKI